MEYTDDQIVDNLIRAKNNLPIMHFDMTKVDASVKTSLSGNFGGGQMLTHTADDTITSNLGVAVGAVAKATQTAVRPLTFSRIPVGITPSMSQ